MRKFKQSSHFQCKNNHIQFTSKMKPKPSNCVPSTAVYWHKRSENYSEVILIGCGFWNIMNTVRMLSVYQVYVFHGCYFRRLCHIRTYIKANTFSSWLKCMNMNNAKNTYWRNAQCIVTFAICLSMLKTKSFPFLRSENLDHQTWAFNAHQIELVH